MFSHPTGALTDGELLREITSAEASGDASRVRELRDEQTSRTETRSRIRGVDPLKALYAHHVGTTPITDDAGTYRSDTGETANGEAR